MRHLFAYTRRQKNLLLAGGIQIDRNKHLNVELLGHLLVKMLCDDRVQRFHTEERTLRHNRINEFLAHPGKCAEIIGSCEIWIDNHRATRGFFRGRIGDRCLLHIRPTATPEHRKTHEQHRRVDKLISSSANIHVPSCEFLAPLALKPG